MNSVICGVHMAESLLTGLVFTFHCVCGSQFCVRHLYVKT